LHSFGEVLSKEYFTPSYHPFTEPLDDIVE